MVSKVPNLSPISNHLVIYKEYYNMAHASDVSDVHNYKSAKKTEAAGPESKNSKGIDSHTHPVESSSLKDKVL